MGKGGVAVRESLPSKLFFVFGSYLELVSYSGMQKSVYNKV